VPSRISKGPPATIQNPACPIGHRNQNEGLFCSLPLLRYGHLSRYCREEKARKKSRHVRRAPILKIISPHMRAPIARKVTQNQKRRNEDSGCVGEGEGEEYPTRSGGIIFAQVTGGNVIFSLTAVFQTNALNELLSDFDCPFSGINR